MGAAGVAGAERALPAGDAVGGAEHGGVREHDFHGVDRAVFSGVAVSPEIRHLLAVCSADCDHELFHILPAAGDEAGSDRGGVFAVAETLVLEQILPAADGECSRIARNPMNESM